MNQRMKRLAELADAGERIILGLMSGTSVDALDLALCKVSGHGINTELELLHSGSRPFDPNVRNQIESLAFDPESATGEVCRLQAVLSATWTELILEQLDEWGVSPDRVDLLASHGQTLLHQPGRGIAPDTTLQLVDGDRLAAGTGILTLSDFRQKHIAAGYEGAPLAPLADLILFAHPTESRYLLNLGGIGNITALPAGSSHMEVPLATDTGPANTLIDEAVRKLLPGYDYDPEGSFSQNGEVIEPLLERFLAHPFFQRDLPASTGQEEFSWSWVHREMLAEGYEIPVRNLLATLVELTACSVGRVMEWLSPPEHAQIYISGGGLKNHYLMERLACRLPGLKLRPLSEIGVDPDAKEAILFAILANETVAGEGWFNRDRKRFVLGKISFPME
ncbi:MAG: anhydro-N-acetylmuramic acid kinase [Balneolaceae bacterium]